MTTSRRSVTVDDVKAECENSLATGPFGSSISSKYFASAGVPVIRGSNLSTDIGHRLVEEEFAFVSEEKATEFRRSVARRGDLIFTCWGTIGQIGLIDARSKYTQYIVSNKQMKLTPDPAKADSLFLYYVFSSPNLQDQIRNQAIGSSVPGFNLGQLRGIRFVLPSLEDQHTIARILGALDDKIELNRRTNETLEAMARALFKSWFVDFDPVRAKAKGRRPSGMDPETAKLFPSGLIDAEQQELPLGWQHRSLYDCASWINGAAYRDFHFSPHGIGLPIVKIAELKAGITRQTRFTTTNPGDKYLIDTGDVLFSWSGNPDTSIDTFVWGGGRAWLNQHIFKVITRTSADRSFILCLLRHLRPTFAEIARNKQTTGLGHVTAGDMKRLLVPHPPAGLIDAFDHQVRPILDLAESRSLENRRLAEVRDTLLPRLLSGELPIRHAERLVEAAL